MSSTGGKRPPAPPTPAEPAEKERARSSPPRGNGSLVLLLSLLSLVGLESLDINEASRFLVPPPFGFKALSFFFSLLSLSLLALSFSRSPAMELVRDQREAVASRAVVGGGGDDKKLLLLVFIVPVGLAGLETLFWFCG